MVDRSLVQAIIALSVAAVAAAGCNGGENTIPQHSADDQKAIDAMKAMSPQQRIDMIQRGPMPQAAKDKMIKDIKQANHLN